MTPRGHTIAYQIWAYANPRGWDCTIAECAEAIGVKSQSVGSVANWKGWIDRFRVGRNDRHAIDNGFVRVNHVTKLDRTDFRASVELPE